MFVLSFGIKSRPYQREEGTGSSVLLGSLFLLALLNDIFIQGDMA